jgi:hypothetical protein
MHMINVRPLNGQGWMIEVDDIQNPQVFQSGRHAETAAKALAGRLASFGEAAEVSIYLRDGSMGGQFTARV